MNITEALAHLTSLNEARTAGPWMVHRAPQMRGVFSIGCKVAECAPWPVEEGRKMQPHNEDFITTSANVMGALLEVVRAAERLHIAVQRTAGDTSGAALDALEYADDQYVAARATLAKAVEAETNG